MQKYYVFVVALGAMLWVGAGCPSQSVPPGSERQNPPSSSGPVSPGATLPAPATGPTGGSTSTGATDWPRPGTWKTLRSTDRKGQVSNVTQLVVAFSAAAQDYEGVEVKVLPVDATLPQGGGAVNLTYWQKGDRFGSSLRSALALTLPNMVAPLQCLMKNPDPNSLRDLERQYYNNQQNLGSEAVTLTTGKTFNTTHYRNTSFGVTVDSWTNDSVPFLLVKRQSSGGSSLELVDYGTSGKQPQTNLVQAASTCSR